MNTSKFKTYKHSSKNLIVTLIFTFLATCFIIKRVCTNISDNIMVIAQKKIETETTLALKKAFSIKNQLNLDTEKLLKVVKNSKDEIVEVDFQIMACENVLMSIVNEVSKTSDMITSDGYIMFIPLGYMTNSPLLVNLGPKIPVKIETTDLVMGNISTKIVDFGLNNALVEIYADIELTITSSLPLNSETFNKKYTSLITSKIIVGSVPSFYSGSLTKQSETFNLPIEGNL